MDKSITVADIMTKNIVSANSEMLITTVASILADHNFDGIPIISKDGKLEGILTEYDLISKGSSIHLPTFISILQNMAVYKRDRTQFKDEVADLAKLKVKDIMNPDPLTLPPTATYEETVAAFRDHHRVNPIPVVDHEKKVLGVVSRYDVLKPLHI
jgi:CBS domain-containing protein